LLLALALPALLSARSDSVGALLQTRTVGARRKPPAPSGPPFGGVKGAFFALSVADIEASAQWYADKLGLAVEARAKSGKTSVIVLSGNGLTVELIRHDDAMDLGKDAFLTHGLFQSRSARREPGQDPCGTEGSKCPNGPHPARANAMANFIIKDNAGNLIQFFGK
jgi:hypothetical protein